MPAPSSSLSCSLRRPLSCLGLAALLSFTGCDKGEGADKDKADEASDAKGSSAAAAGGTPADKQVKTFLEDQRKKACEMLSPAMVAKQYSVPEAELRQIKIGGCNYRYKSDDDSRIVEVSIVSIFVRDDAAAARKQFDNATKSLSAEEVKAQVGMVMGKTKESEEVDTKTKEKAVDQIGGAMAGMVPDAGYQYEDVDGVGDAARILTHNANLTVLVGNMVFTVTAYAGPPAPKPDMSGAGADMDKIVAIAKQADAEWMDQTREVRKQQAIELAKAIVEEL